MKAKLTGKILSAESAGGGDFQLVIESGWQSRKHQYFCPTYSFAWKH